MLRIHQIHMYADSTHRCCYHMRPQGGLLCAANEGRLRLMEGASGPGYQYGRLEILLRGFWNTVCDREGFTPDSAQVACKALGFDGGAALEFRQEHSSSGGENEVRVRVRMPKKLHTPCLRMHTSSMPLQGWVNLWTTSFCLTPQLNNFARVSIFLSSKSFYCKVQIFLIRIWHPYKCSHLSDNDSERACPSDQVMF